MYLFGVFVYILAFISLYSSSVSDVKWFKVAIAVVFSALVSILVTFNMFN